MPEDKKGPTGQLDPAARAGTTDVPRKGAKKRRDANEPAAVVGIGASAGGIAPLQEFFEEMKPDTGLAFVVVMHLSPDFDSQLAAVIQQKTSMPVVQVSEAVKVRPNHVYVIPPNHQLTFEEGLLRLVPPQQELGRRVTIDLFFRTLAQAFGQRAVSIIMSGTDSDGVIGLKHVRAQGGVTIAQNPEEAEFDSMPQSAIATGMVDWVLQVADMPRRLLEFVRNEHAMQLPPEIKDAREPDAKVADAPGGETISDETRDPDDEGALFLVLKHLRAHTHHDFSHYKRATILRRVARRLQVNSLDSIPRYLEFLREHPAEVRALLSDLLIGVTHFFRDHAAFAALDANVPQLFAGKHHGDELRVWVAGCATGEEAYSIAMLLCEYADRLSDPPSVQVFATDIDEQAIHDARDGLYPLTIEADVSQERLRQFFVRDNGRYRVKKDLRDKLLFASHNVLSDPAFSRLDLVSCRNLLIYLNREAQARVFDIFHFGLRPSGLLFIGGAESADHAHVLFSPLDTHHRIYVRRSIPRPGWRIPTLPSRVAPPRHRTAGETYPPMLPRMASAAVEGAGDQTQTAAFEGQQRRSVLFGELHLKLLEEYGPPSVVVNEAHDIVHLSEHAGRYLSFRAGEPSTNLMAVVNPVLRVELRTALFRAAQSNGNVIVPAQHVEIDGGTETIDLHVRPIRPGDSAHGFFLVLFEKSIPPLTAEEQSAERATISREVGDELQSLKEQLNATVEQFEASSEELKASNEELQAMNEELRSAAEELETSKEELQSVNEELITVNQELKDKVEELSRANSDLNNLMKATDLATIFLDRHLRVVRFTPRIQETFNLLPADVGRPISDITHKLRFETLIADTERVLERLVPIEREVETADGRSFLVRIAPYRTLDDRISGVVVTLIDITEIKRAEAEVRAGTERYRTLFELVPVAVYMTDADGVIQEYNHRAEEMWGRSPIRQGEKFCGSFKMYYPDGRWMPHEECPMARVLRGEELGPNELEVIVERETGERLNVAVAPRTLKDDAGNILGAINCVHDVTHRKQAEEALRKSEDRFRTVADNVPQLIWTNDAEGTANYFNKRWFDYSGLSYEESHGRGWQAVVHPEDEPESVDRWKRALAKGKVFDAEYRLRAADGGYRWFIGRNVPLRENGNVLSWFGSATDIDDFKKAQARLGESEERFRVLVDGARDYAMFLIDPSNTIVFWSKGAERIFGWSRQEAIGQNGHLIFTPEDRAEGAVEKEIGIALRDGRAPDRRYHLRKDGTRFWADGVLMRLDDERGEVRGFAKVARDASDQKAIEEALRHAKDEMEQRVVERTRDLLAINNELERTMSQRQQLEKELLEISEREKRRIGEDLHDMVCQELTATALFLKSSAKRVASEAPAAAETLDEAAQIVNRNVGLTRDLARGLQPTELTGPGLKQALKSLADQACESTSITCHFKAKRGVRVTDDTVALSLYRVTQEAVKNAVKHSGADQILITLDKTEDLICVSIEDNGKGFNPARRSKGLGLHLMRYRARALGGELEILKRRSGGTEIRCKIPLKRAVK